MLNKHKYVPSHFVCVTYRTSGIVLDLSQPSWSSILRSRRSSTSSELEYRSVLTSHVYCVAFDRRVAWNQNCFIWHGCAFDRTWSRWPENRTERRTDWPSRKRQKASESKCWGVWTHFPPDRLYWPQQSGFNANVPSKVYVSEPVFILFSIDTSQWIVMLSWNPNLMDVYHIIWWMCIRFGGFFVSRSGK